MRYSGLRTALAAVSLLVLGAVGGIAGDRHLAGRGSHATLPLSAVHHDPVGTIDRAIQLRPEQRTRIEAIFARRQPAIDAVWHHTHEQLQATVDSVVDEIAHELDPDQAERFRALADELHSTGRLRMRH
jgi:hypothetical protein